MEAIAADEGTKLMDPTWVRRLIGKETQDGVDCAWDQGEHQGVVEHRIMDRFNNRFDASAQMRTLLASDTSELDLGGPLMDQLPMDRRLVRSQIVQRILGGNEGLGALHRNELVQLVDDMLSADTPMNSADLFQRLTRRNDGLYYTSANSWPQNRLFLTRNYWTGQGVTAATINGVLWGHAEFDRSSNGFLKRT